MARHPVIWLVPGVLGTLLTGRSAPLPDSSLQGPQAEPDGADPDRLSAGPSVPGPDPQLHPDPTAPMSRGAPPSLPGERQASEADPLAQLEAPERDSWVEAQTGRTTGSAARNWVLSPGTDPTTTTGDAASIQAALDAAMEGDIITLLEGQYVVNLNFPRKMITLRGAPSATQDQVILDGSQCVRGATECSVITFDWITPLGPGTSAELSGLTLTGGRGRQFSDVGASSDAYGGGVWSGNGDMDIVAVTLRGNRADYGGGMYLHASPAALSQVIVSGNSANYGGGLALDSASPTLFQVAITGNSASSYGGGLYLVYFSYPVLSQTTLSGNSALEGGGIHLTYSYPTLHNSLLAFNVAGLGSNLNSDGSTLIAQNCLFWLPDGTSGVYGVTPPTRLIIADPLLYDDPTDGSPVDDDAHLRAGSPAIQGGEETRWDPGSRTFVPNSSSGGTPPDLGAFGGPGNTAVDNDGDGAPDDWEAARGLNTDGDDDYDGDRLTDGEEFNLGTEPTRVDSDGDHHPDGDEVTNGTDPLNGISPPRSGDAPSTVWVPRDYPSIQQAILSVGEGAIIQVDPGTYVGDTRIWYRSLTLESASGASTTVLDGGGAGSVLSLFATAPGFELRGFTVTGGDAPFGGGILMIGAGGTLNSVDVTHNSATSLGGGIYLDASAPILSQVSVSGNSALLGGGLSASDSSPTLSQVTVWGNNAHYGGGMWIYGSSFTLSEVSVAGNNATYSGGGIYLFFSPVSLSQVSVSENSASEYGGGIYLSSSSPALWQVSVSANNANNGGGMYLYDSSPSLSQVAISGNNATQSGGGLSLQSSSPILSQVTVSGNSAADTGGGLDLSLSSAVLSHVTVAGNSASGSGGGMYTKTSSPRLHNTLIAHNTAPTGATIYRYESETVYSPNLTNTLLYPVAGNTLYNVSAPSVPFDQDPLFVDDPTDGNTTDDNYHLSPDSPARDVGALSGCLDPDTGTLDAPCADPDGSLPDLGAWGGPGADEWDGDGDGAPAPWWPVESAGSAAVEEGYNTAPFDCNDADASIYPGGLEIPADGIDNNCNGVVDEGEGSEPDGGESPTPEPTPGGESPNPEPTPGPSPTLEPNPTPAYTPGVEVSPTPSAQSPTLTPDDSEAGCGCQGGGDTSHAVAWGVSFWFVLTRRRRPPPSTSSRPAPVA